MEGINKSEVNMEFSSFGDPDDPFVSILSGLCNGQKQLRTFHLVFGEHRLQLLSLMNITAGLCAILFNLNVIPLVS